MLVFAGWILACSGDDTEPPGGETGSTPATTDTGTPPEPTEPEVVSITVTPAQGALGIRQPIVVDFDAPMDEGSLRLGGTLSTSSPIDVQWESVRADEVRLTLTPESTWAASVAHTMTIAVDSAAGTPVQAQRSYSVDTQIAFVTTQQGDGDLSGWPSAGGATGRAAGDAICASVAAEAGLEGEFRALLSDGVADAGCVLYGLDGQMADTCGVSALPSPLTWQRPDGAPLGDSESMFEAFLLNPIGQQLDGSPVSVDAWYGTRPFNCGDWTRDDDKVDGRTHPMSESRLKPAVDTWQSFAPACDTDHPLICLQFSESTPLAPPRTDGLRFFVSSAEGPGDLGSWPEADGKSGIDAGDAICQGLAAKAGLTPANAFRALLSDPDVDAIDRFPEQGPWVRMDGALLGETFSDLLTPSISRPFDETGGFVEADPLERFHRAWTGTSSSTGLASGNDQCAAWSDGTFDAFTAFGSYSWTGSWGTTWSGTIPCGNDAHLYCVELPPGRY